MSLVEIPHRGNQPKWSGTGALYYPEVGDGFDYLHVEVSDTEVVGYVAPIIRQSGR